LTPFFKESERKQAAVSIGCSSRKSNIAIIHLQRRAALDQLGRRLLDTRRRSASPTKLPPSLSQGHQALPRKTSDDDRRPAPEPSRLTMQTASLSNMCAIVGACALSPPATTSPTTQSKAVDNLPQLQQSSARSATII
jgi:hypothetical protein